MTDLNEEFLRSWGDATQVMQLNRRFRSFIYQTAHNRYLASVLDDRFDHLAILGGSFELASGRSSISTRPTEAVTGFRQRL
jgi:DNA-binding GntR family transcriptional regulator